MNLNPIQAASYSWNTHSGDGLSGVLEKVRSTIDSFFTAIFQGFSVSIVEQDNYCIVDWRKNTIAGRAIEKAIKNRTVTSANCSNAGFKQ